MAAALTVVGLLPATAASAATVVPQPTNALPQALDVATTYRQQYSCDPAAKAGVERFLRMLLQTYPMGHSGGIVRGCGIGSTSEHKEGRAVDFMLSVNVPEQKAAGDALTAWLTGKDEHGVIGGNARRVGVMYVIWNKRIWSVYSTAGWRTYTGPVPHTDHVHLSFSWDGAMARTSWWDGSPVTNVDQGPCPVYSGQPAPVYTTRRTSPCPGTLTPPASTYGIVWPGQSSSSVKVAQAKLGVNADGSFGPQTRTALFAWQRSADVPVTGVLDKPTWAKLVPTATPAPTPVPTTTGTAAPTPSQPAPTPVVTTMLTPYLSTTLLPGSRGAAVVALQRALGITADGTFGAGTEASVISFQTSVNLPPSGQVDPATWASLQRAVYPLLPYRSIVLKRGVKGQTTAVKALQTALKVGSDGVFGPVTETAVKAAQKRAGLSATGVVDAPTWAAVEAAAYPLGSVLRVAASTPVERLAGADRYATAAAVVHQFAPGVPVAYVASGLDFPDALAGAAAAGAQGSPVLLTSPRSVPAATQQALAYLKPKKIVVLGGTASVSDAVLATLRTSTGVAVTRIGGANRYATAAKVSAAVTPAGVAVAYVASGGSFADALAGAALAGSQKAPVLLTSARSLPSDTVTELKRLRPGRIVVLGGAGVVSASVATQLKALTAGSVTRLAGDDRYETAATIAAAMPGAKAVYVASGQSFPDALAGAALAAKQAVPVLLVTSGSVPSATRNALPGMKPTRIVALGGAAPVSDMVATVLGAFEQH
jgi:putative cell wall-binding protein/peptidoglycan hydrolase-like protein with peptidoglycan-binding domain